MLLDTDVTDSLTSPMIEGGPFQVAEKLYAANCVDDELWAEAIGASMTIRRTVTDTIKIFDLSCISNFCTFPNMGLNTARKDIRMMTN